jgi:hypothetical protein
MLGGGGFVQNKVVNEVDAEEKERGGRGGGLLTSV